MHQLRLTRRRAAIVSIACALAAAVAACSGCPPPVEKYGWRYSATSLRSGVHATCVYHLSYRGRELDAYLTLVTPFGTLQNLRAEEPGNDSGWLRVEQRTSEAIPVAAAAIPPEALQAGWYSSDGRTRLRGTPESWVYLAGVDKPCWVAPEKLFDVSFVTTR